MNNISDFAKLKQIFEFLGFEITNHSCESEHYFDGGDGKKKILSYKSKFVIEQMFANSNMDNLNVNKLYNILIKFLQNG